jgi:hypothetical protein
VYIRAAIRHWYRQSVRQGRALRARLRREGVVVSLLALLTLGLGEPLLCILHCQVWLPSAYQGYFSPHAQHDQHTQHQHGMSATVPAAASDGSSVVVSPHASAIDPGCFMAHAAGDQSGVPFHVPPSPIHDVLPSVLIFSIALLMLYTHPASPPGDPPDRTCPPLLRPPIRLAH